MYRLVNENQDEGKNETSTLIILQNSKKLTRCYGDPQKGNEFSVENLVGKKGE